MRAVQGRTVIFDVCKPSQMGVFRKPRFSKDDVEKAMEGFFNRLLYERFISYYDTIRRHEII